MVPYQAIIAEADKIIDSAQKIVTTEDIDKIKELSEYIILHTRMLKILKLGRTEQKRKEVN